MSPQHPLFPVNLICQWQPAAKFDLPDHLLTWLLEPGSLTAKLKQHSQSFRVEVLGQKIEACDELEANEVIQAGDKVLVREVLLYCDDTPQVFARSLMPLSTLTDEEQQLAELGTQPLGQVLFNNPTLERKNLEIAYFDQNTSVAKLVNTLSINVNETIRMWGRRSLFFIHQKPLMVAEIFLPGGFAYQQGFSTDD